jgi:hypothetical protein
MSASAEFMTVKAWGAVENAAKAMSTDNGSYAWDEDDEGMAGVEDTDLLAWVDDCEARLGADVVNFRSAMLDFIAIRCGGKCIDPEEYAQAIKNITGGAA